MILSGRIWIWWTVWRFLGRFARTSLSKAWDNDSSYYKSFTKPMSNPKEFGEIQANTFSQNKREYR